MAIMDPVGYAELAGPEKFITLSDMLNAAKSALPFGGKSQSVPLGVPSSAAPVSPFIQSLGGNVATPQTPGWTPSQLPNTVYEAFRTPQAGAIDPTITARQAMPSSPTPARSTAAITPRDDRAPSTPARAMGSAATPARSPQPISIVRGLVNTEYLPQIDAKGNVQYVSSEELAARGTRKAAAEKTAAETDKLRAEAIKNVRLSPTEKAQQMQLNRAIDLQSLLNTMPPNDADREKTEREYNRIMNSLTVKTQGSDLLLADFFDRQRERQQLGIQ